MSHIFHWYVGLGWFGTSKKLKWTSGQVPYRLHSQKYLKYPKSKISSLQELNKVFYLSFQLFAEQCTGGIALLLLVSEETLATRYMKLIDAAVFRLDCDFDSHKKGDWEFLVWGKNWWCRLWTLRKAIWDIRLSFSFHRKPLYITSALIVLSHNDRGVHALIINKQHVQGHYWPHSFSEAGRPKSGLEAFYSGDEI